MVNIHGFEYLNQNILRWKDAEISVFFGRHKKIITWKMKESAMCFSLFFFYFGVKREFFFRFKLKYSF